MPARKETHHIRQRLAYQAARLMVEEGVADLNLARKKAAERLRVGNRRFWPDAIEVREALLQQQRLFQPSQPQALRRLRQVALEAMRALARFRPRLVGAVRDGSADRGTPVCLQVFAETSDEVIHFLLQSHIPWQQRERLLLYRNGERRRCPSLHFLVGEAEIELLVLANREMRDPPLDPLSLQAERGAGIEQVLMLLDTPAGDA
jgi:hypothetical protein